MIRTDAALEYHTRGRPGKLEVVPSKPCLTQRDLSLAYTPGVAIPCLEIRDDPDAAYRYTGRGNLVAVVSNGSAVLGLGDIGALAGKPVMEGKAVLFKRFADVDVFDIEIDSHDPDEIIETVARIAPTFGGINLEDIKAPECFYIEETLEKRLDIPVFHDDQHGTAIISGAALLNALELARKEIDRIRVVVSGAGAAGIACARYYVTLGVRPENLLLCDSRGVVYRGREEGMNPFKEALAVDTPARTLTDALEGADVFVGLSVAGLVKPEMLRRMAPDPIVFAMANPTPEISYPEAVAVRSDVIAATGRSDYPNQVNNVLGFPFIFRGALDVRATHINEAMKLAATRALADLAKDDVPDAVMRAYGLERLRFGREYLIPKPFDHRALIRVASAVAVAAMESGVARRQVDPVAYREELERRLGKSREVLRLMINRAKRRPMRVALAEAEHPRVLRAAQAVLDEGFAVPLLVGPQGQVERSLADLELRLDGVEIVDPRTAGSRQRYAEELYRLRCRKGLTRHDAEEALEDSVAFASMMVRMGDADALIAGSTRHYPDALRPVLQIVGTRQKRAHAVFLMIVKDRVYFFADPSVNIEPDAAELAEIAISTADLARSFHVEPRVAMLSFSNFGSVRHPVVEKVRQATEIVRRARPDLVIDGEVQASVALSTELLHELFPFSALEEAANVLVFPDLHSANTAYQVLQRIGGAESIGPILTGMRYPVHILQHGCDEKDIVAMTAIAAIDAMHRQEEAAAVPVEARPA